MNELDLFGDGPALFVPTFEAWYARYPRKAGKAKARERWGKMSAPERASAWIALDGWEVYVAAAGTTYVPYASTWLNQARWEDEAPSVPLPERREAPGMAAIRRRLQRTVSDGAIEVTSSERPQKEIR